MHGKAVSLGDILLSATYCFGLAENNISNLDGLLNRSQKQSSGAVHV